MKANKNKMTEEQRKVYDFIESNVTPTHRVGASLFMGHLSFIRDSCKKYGITDCVGCPFNSTGEKYGDCLLRLEYPDKWQIEKMIKNIYSNLD